MFFEQWISRQADIKTADAHVNTEEKEVSMIAMTNTVVEPCWCIHCQGGTAETIFTPPEQAATVC